MDGLGYHGRELAAVLRISQLRDEERERSVGNIRSAHQTRRVSERVRETKAISFRYLPATDQEAAREVHGLVDIGQRLK